MILLSRKIFTSNKLEIQSNTINQIARWYFKDELQIYPSKLVWSLNGARRLDTILSFIKNDFSIKFKNYEGYFDMRVIPSMRQKSIIQKHPILPLHLCCNFADYELPVTLTSQDDDTVKEIYRRLISNKPLHLRRCFHEN